MERRRNDRDVLVSIGGTAQRHVDYVLGGYELDFGSTVRVRIPAGQASATLTVTPLFDVALEPLETVVLTAEGTPATATIADEPAATIAATDATAAELGGDTATFIVTRGGATPDDRDVLVSIGGTAQRHVDYVLGGYELDFGPTVRVRIPAGQASATLTVTPIDDGVPEGLEDVALTAEGTVATATIVDGASGAVTVTVVATDTQRIRDRPRSRYLHGHAHGRHHLGAERVLCDERRGDQRRRLRPVGRHDRDSGRAVLRHRDGDAPDRWSRRRH